MTLTCIIVVLLTSLLALPFSYVLNIVSQGKDQKMIFLTSSLGFLMAFLVPQYIIRVRSKPPRPKLNSFIHVLSLLTFNSVMSLVTALENDGLIAEFLGSFLREGEPHLKSAHGTMMCYWDGICHNAMYLHMMAALSWNQSFYDVGLYWAGSFGHRLLVLSLTIMIGKAPMRWTVLVYLPLIAICVWAAKHFMNEKREELKAIQEEHLKDADNLPKTSIWRRPWHLAFMIFYLSASAIATFRFVATMGASGDITKKYIEMVEPYLDDPLQFAKSEILVQQFYFVPYYVLSIIALLQPGESWVLQWSILYAGAAGQGQFSFMGSSLHYRTPYIFRVPQSGATRRWFWCVNGLLFLVPQLMALIYNQRPDFFVLDNASTKRLENGSVPSNSEKGATTTTTAKKME